MWYWQAVIMTFMFFGAILVFGMLGRVINNARGDVVAEGDGFTRKGGTIALLILFIVIWIISSLVVWGCHVDERNKYNNFLSVYEKAVKPCIEEESLSYYTVNCNIAYQLEQLDYTIEDYNDWVKYYGTLDTDWLEKYSGIHLPAYIKVLNVNSSCLCDGNDCGAKMERKP
jgi:hypothetical protein